MTRDQREDETLETFFEAARETPPQVSADLLQRVQAEALIALDARATARRVPPAGTPWQRLLAGLGGWPALGGLTAATVAGVWIGVAAPEVIRYASGGYIGAGGSDYLIDVDYELALGVMPGEGG